MKKRVMDRAAEMCERCHINKASQVHHFTYQRLGNEELDDLAAVCEGCHRFISGQSNEDPVSAFFAHLPNTYSWLFTQCQSFKQLKDLWNYLECPEDCEGCASLEMGEQ